MPRKAKAARPGQGEAACRLRSGLHPDASPHRRGSQARWQGNKAKQPRSAKSRHAALLADFGGAAAMSANVIAFPHPDPRC